MCLCVLWMRSAEAICSRRHNTLLIPQSLAGTCVPYKQLRGKGASVLNEVVKVSEVEFLFGARKFLFEASADFAIRGLQGNRYFCIYLFLCYCLFIYYSIPKYITVTMSRRVDNRLGEKQTMKPVWIFLEGDVFSEIQEDASVLIFILTRLSSVCLLLV